MRTALCIAAVFLLTDVPPTLAAPDTDQSATTAAQPEVVTSDGGAVPAKAANFLLLDQEGVSHELHREGVGAKAIVLYFQGNGCPIVRQSIPQLKALRDAYTPKGVKFFMINANSQDDRDSVVEEATEFQIDMPILLDESQMVATTLGTVRTAEALLIDTSTWKILYRGAIDDRIDFLGAKKEAEHAWLNEALDAFLAGQPLATPRTPTKGCLITFKEMPEKISYVDDIVPILKDHCVVCHSPGNIAPFALSSHSKIEGWSDMIREVVLTKRMPPWHADPHRGAFSNDRGLSAEETETLVSWLDQGAPQDGPKDPLGDLMQRPKGEWTLGEPDMVVELPETQTIPASGVFDYRYIEIPSGLTEDQWVRAVDVQASNRKVAHHVLVFLRYPDRLRYMQPDQEGGLQGFFGGYVPGQEPAPFPKGSGKWVPAGATFVFQLHYNATGKEETDRTRMALYFMDEKPKQELVTTAAANVDFAIKPGDPDSETVAKHFVTRDAVLYAMSPHMHYRGKRFQFDAQYPDGTNETLLSVPNYDFDWQTLYELKEPKRLPAGTVIVATGAFDNSAANPYNPNPEATVFFGEQTFEEMFIGYLNYTVDPEQEELSIAQQQPEFDWFPLDATSIVGTAWRVEQYVIAFQPDGKLLVNNAIEGTWSIEDNTVNAQAAGRDIRFAIDNDHLETRRGRPLRRVE